MSKGARRVVVGVIGPPSILVVGREYDDEQTLEFVLQAANGPFDGIHVLISGSGVPQLRAKLFEGNP